MKNEIKKLSKEYFYNPAKEAAHKLYQLGILDGAELQKIKLRIRAKYNGTAIPHIKEISL